MTTGGCTLLGTWGDGVTHTAWCCRFQLGGQIRTPPQGLLFYSIVCEHLGTKLGSSMSSGEDCNDVTVPRSKQNSPYLPEYMDVLESMAKGDL